MIKEPVQCVCIVLILISWSLTNAELFNIALNKPTFQSGTLEYPDANHRWLSQHAVDGKKNCPSGADSQYYSGTDSLNTPWWQVDLGRMFTIEKVVVYGQPQEVPHQLKGFWLYITRENFTNSSAVAYENTGAYGNGIFVININASHQQGRYLTIDLPQTVYSDRAIAGPLVLCEVEIFTQVSDVAKVADITVSSTLVYGSYNYDKDNVIDNMTSNQSIDTCGCCWVSANEINPQIQFILPGAEKLVAIIVIGRTDRGNTSDGFNLNGIAVFTDDRPVNKDNIYFNQTDNTAVVTFLSQEARNVTISRLKFRSSSSWYLAICEIYIYVDAPRCIAGTFGRNCENLCSYCQDNNCNSETGHCISGCQSGYSGEFCNQTCTQHYYGNNCPIVCGHCKNNEACHHINGSCLNGCAPGYKPEDETCKTACDSGTYGQDCVRCSTHCYSGFSQCDRFNGTCLAGCESGYMGLNCTTPCPLHYYGNNCSQVCGHCKNNETCHHINGSCLHGCAPGYKPEDKMCTTACDTGTYGQECVRCSTHCYHGVSQCDKFTGTCVAGCEPGYMGHNCTTQCPDGRYGRNCNESCGQCASNSHCNILNGSCPAGCKPGFKGDICKTICEDGKYGANCNNYCHCKDDAACNKSTGQCPGGCGIGWTGGNCPITCDTGTYGQNCVPCSMRCYNGVSQCDKFTGTCVAGCEPGYMGHNCTTQCPDGKYGRNCNESCGQCAINSHCNILNGSCPRGCKPGFKGDICKTLCEDRKYGANCNKYCHCKDDAVCNKTTGQCPNGCDILWTGDNCSANTSFIYSIRKNVTTTQIGTYSSNIASNAIDGVDDYINESCGCCSIAQRPNESVLTYWEIDLGKKYLINAVSIFSRSDGLNKEQIQHAEVYAGNESLAANSSSGLLIFTVPSEINTKFHFGHEMGSPIMARFFIVRLNTSYLTLCEFLLGKTDCPNGSFGNGCLNRCHCKGNTRCDPVTGHCPTKFCEPGWQGDACNTTCDNRRFGDDCINTCLCVNGTGCDPVNGICEIPQCEDGWKGSSCSSVCISPSFGFRCNRTCHCISGSHCNHVDGLCDINQCDDGWKGVACHEVCPQYYYGNDCSQVCGHCKNNETCHHINGSCLHGCASGYKPEDKMCKTAENLLIQMKNKIYLEMSSVYNETWTPALAVDGETGPDPDTCHCCSRTENSEMSWWRVDLNGLYPLKYVTISGRKEGSGIIDQLGGFSLYLTNTSETGSVAFYTDNNKIPNTLYRISLNNSLARFITIKRPGVLTICEVVLIEGECIDGYFGENCSSQCNCLDKRPCDRTMGTCVAPFCKLGWMGLSCNIRVCPPGWFGEGCNKQCFCADGDVCSHDYGICPRSCMTGYQGPQCNLNTTSSIEAAETSSRSITIGASVSAAVAIALVASLVVFVTYRRRVKAKDKPGDIYTQPDFNLSTNTGDYDTLETPQSQTNNGDATHRVSSM